MTDDERELVFELATALSGALVVNYEQVNSEIARSSTASPRSRP